MNDLTDRNKIGRIWDLLSNNVIIREVPDERRSTLRPVPKPSKPTSPVTTPSTPTTRKLLHGPTTEETIRPIPASVTIPIKPTTSSSDPPLSSPATVTSFLRSKFHETFPGFKDVVSPKTDVDPDRLFAELTDLTVESVSMYSSHVIERCDVWDRFKNNFTRIVLLKMGCNNATVYSRLLAEMTDILQFALSKLDGLSAYTF